MLSVRPKPYIIPTYSLTGDLLSYLRCPLQYRYYNKGALPPSTPVQQWFGEFIHGFLEEAFEQWRIDPVRQQFPWNWNPQVRDLELRISQRLAARGLNPPPRLFCPYSPAMTKSGLCPDDQHPHFLVASQRAEAAVNTWGPHLFPLISEAEVRLKGARDMPNFQEGVSRANYYGVTGVIDVISSVRLAATPRGNLLLHYLNRDEQIAPLLRALSADGFEIIIDYKGMRRPAKDDPKDPTWAHHAWQVTTYAWLRARQQQALPIVAGLIFYLNELVPSGEDFKALQDDVAQSVTDILPVGVDAKALRRWQPRMPLLALSAPFREARSLRVIPIDTSVINGNLRRFDDVVDQIETAVRRETAGTALTVSWDGKPEPRTCTACDFKTYCPKVAGSYPPTVP